jgi:hypothetical protein
MITRCGACEAQHHWRRVNADGAGTPPGGGSHRIAWATTDVDDAVGGRYRGQLSGQASAIAPHDQHAEGSHQTGHTGKARVVGVMVDHR